ncbi:MAG: efflux RND transporter periplasmic adaptor subunit [Opitutaceae bacterium]|nr:efflux RND transporter periplasmic adaptor subunit [Opitutaceae bacterium]
MQRLRPFLAAACVATIVLVSPGCGKKSPGAGGPPGGGAGSGGIQKQPVEVTAASRRDLIDTLTIVGSLAANESAEIRPEISGLVREILFTEGQPVTKGAVLVRIDDAELRAQLAQVQARFELARLNVARSENLSETNTIPQSETDRARSEFASAKAELALLQTRLEKTQVKAPFDGIVGARVISPGDYVTASTVITTLDDLTRLKVDFQVPERFLSKVTVGTSFSLRSRALSNVEAVKGEVYFVSSVIDRNTRSSEVKGFLAEPPAALKPGMFANIELVLDVRRAALTVPEGAIRTVPGGSEVIAVREAGADKVADFVPVQLGMRAKGLVEVTPLKGELTEGTPVVAAGVGALIIFPNAKLEPRPIREEFRVGD